MEILSVDINKISPYEKNPRKNQDAIKQVETSIKKYGFKQPIVVDKDFIVIIGHTRLEAAKRLKMQSVPVVVADDLTAGQVKALRIADNKTHEFAKWEKRKLRSEITEILFDFPDEELYTGFDEDEIDKILGKIGFENSYDDKSKEFDMSMILFPVEVALNESDYRTLKKAMEKADIKTEINFVRYVAKMILEGGD